jgi:hypothetical protein
VFHKVSHSVEHEPQLLCLFCPGHSLHNYRVFSTGAAMPDDHILLMCGGDFYRVDGISQK